MLTPAHLIALKLATAPVFLDRAALRGEPLLHQMADDLRWFVAAAGCVTADDLELLGWTRAQAEAHGREAARRAYAGSARPIGPRP